MGPAEIQREQRPVLEQDITIYLGLLQNARRSGDSETEKMAELELNLSLQEYGDLLKAMGRTCIGL